MIFFERNAEKKVIIKEITDGKLLYTFFRVKPYEKEKEKRKIKMKRNKR